MLSLSLMSRGQVLKRVSNSRQSALPSPVGCLRLGSLAIDRGTTVAARL
jgi:hypothetical protein